MKDIKILLVAAALASFASSRSLAGEIKIIANSSVRADSISADDLKRIYLEERSSLRDGTHVEPVLEKGGSVHQAFLKQFLGKTEDDLQTFYQSLVFTGRGSMPKELASDDDMVAYVAKTRGAIGYVSFENSAEGVKTLAVEDGRDSGERKLITRIEPEYPATLKKMHIGGTVRLQLTIAPKGNVEAVVVLGGNPILGETATSAVKSWIYTPNHSSTTIEVSIPFDPAH
jgi:TonB family protein